MSRGVLKKRKADSYQKAVMSNFLVGKAEGKEMKPCPICGIYLTEEKLVKHASICGIDPGALFVSQTQTQTSTQIQVSQIDDTQESQSKVAFRGSTTDGGSGDNDLSENETSMAEDTPVTKKRSVESMSPKSAKSAFKFDNRREEGTQQHGQGKENAFSKLMKAASQAAQQEKVSKSVSHFRLDVVQGALLTTFRHDDEEEEQHVGSCITSWSEEVQFRQVLQTMTFDDSANTSEDLTKVEAKDKRLDMRVMISTNLPCAEAPSVEFGDNPQGENYGSDMRYYAVYKSMLQKAVRRRETDKAARLAARMMALSSTEFFRRVPIICVEDAALHPEFGVVVWVMVALSKGYRAPLCLLEACLGFISDLASSPFRDIPLDCVPLSTSVLSRGIEDDEVGDLSGLDSASPHAFNPSGSSAGNRSLCVSLRDLPPGSQRTLIMSLLFRASYGGMRFDVSMLESMARLWALRFFYGPSYAVTDLDKLRLPTLKFNLHQSAIISLMSDSAWGKQCVEAFPVDPTMASTLKKELHVSVRAALLRGGADDGDFSNPELLARALPLRKVDLVEPGVDFHCDSGLCEYVLRTLRQNTPEKYERLAQMAKETPGSDGPSQSDYDAMVLLVKKCVWTFRSSTNSHKVWEEPGEDTKTKEAIEQHTKAELETKRRLAPAWGLIAATIASYCANKVSFIAEKEGLPSS